MYKQNDWLLFVIFCLWVFGSNHVWVYDIKLCRFAFLFRASFFFYLLRWINIAEMWYLLNRKFRNIPGIRSCLNTLLNKNHMKYINYFLTTPNLITSDKMFPTYRTANIKVQLIPSFQLGEIVKVKNVGIVHPNIQRQIVLLSWVDELSVVNARVKFPFIHYIQASLRNVSGLLTCLITIHRVFQK